jgi:predicted secreted protein
MSSIAAYKKKVQVSADAGITFYDLPATSPSLEIAGDVIDDTDLASNEGYRTSCQGLNDWSSSADSNFKPLTGNVPNDTASGAKGLSLVLNAKVTRGQLVYRYLPTGVDDDGTGLQGIVIVETFSFAGEIGGLETISISLKPAGPLELLELP